MSPPHASATAGAPGAHSILGGSLPIIAAASTGVQVGAALVASRFVIAETTPVVLALLRYGLAFALLLPFILAARARTSRRIARRDLLPIAAIGVAQFGGLIVVLNYGLQFVSSARAALIFALFPLLTMLLAAAAGHERLTWARTLGVLATILGVAIALSEKLFDSRTGTAEWLGALAVFGSALIGASCSVLYRPYLRRYPALPVSGVAMLASVVFLAILAGAEGIFTAGPRFSTAGWLAVAFIGASSGIFFFLWMWALRHTAATKVAVFLALGPVTAMILGAWLLDEPVTPLAVVGLAAVVFGLWLAHREKPAPAVPAAG